MQAYLDLLRDAYENGQQRPDRTGTGRKSVFGRHLRFDLSKGFPVVTTRFISTMAAKAELLWFIKGSANIAELRELGATFWNRWGVTEDHVKDFLENRLPVQLTGVPREQLEQYLMSFVDQIGPIYGINWRNLPYGESDYLLPVDTIAFGDIPKDKLAIYKDSYDRQVQQQLLVNQGELPGDFLSFEQFAIDSYHMTKDQLNDLLINLRDNPYSARLVVSAWIPTRLPSESMSPQDNVFFKKGALAPCHMFFQCFVEPPKEAGGRPKLSLKMDQRSLIERP